MYDLIIIGGGPAGITAGIYGARQKLKTLLVTKEFGGQVVKKAMAIENYPGTESATGEELMARFKKHLMRFAAETTEDEILKIEKQGDGFFIVGKSGAKWQSKAVIIASGADPRLLKVPGEEKFLGRGVGYCVTCDGPLFKDKIVAVVGGGNSAFEAALFLAGFAKKVYLLEPKEVSADKINQDRVIKNSLIENLPLTVPREIKGDDFVRALTVENLATSQKQDLAVGGVFIEIGYSPAVIFVEKLVEFNEKSEIKIDQQTGATSTPGLFAAGDVTDTKVKQVVVAAASGAKAALSAAQYIREAI